MSPRSFSRRWDEPSKERIAISISAFGNSGGTSRSSSCLDALSTREGNNKAAAVHTVSKRNPLKKSLEDASFIGVGCLNAEGKVLLGMVQGRVLCLRVVSPRKQGLDRHPSNKVAVE